MLPRNSPPGALHSVKIFPSIFSELPGATDPHYHIRHNVQLTVLVNDMKEKATDGLIPVLLLVR